PITGLGKWEKLIRMRLNNIERFELGPPSSVSRRIFAAALTVGSLTMISKIAATLKETVLARQFGVSDGLDAFLIAYIVPSAAINIIAGAISLALVPTYIQVRERDGREAAQQLLGSITSWGAVMLVGVSVLLAAATPWVLPHLASGFGPDKIALTRSLFWMLLPVLLVTGLSATWGAILNAGERFVLAAIVPTITPLVIMMLVFVGSIPWGVHSIAVGTVLGSVVEASLLAWGLHHQGISVLPRWFNLSREVKQVIRQYAPLTVGCLLTSSSTVVDQCFAAAAGSGSVSALNYGGKIASVLSGVGAMAVATAVLPYFSQMAAEEDWKGLRRVLRVYCGLILAVSIPVTLILCLGSPLLIRLLFQRGAFTADDTLLVASVQRFYLLQIPFFTLGMLCVRAVSALKANYILMWVAAITLGVNVALDYLFMKWYGVAGIALSTAVVYLVSFCCIAGMLLRLLGKLERQPERTSADEACVTRRLAE
nr:murein biosynthesis integral membrane protein MurJ [Armatimonadota bacterium]